MDHQSRIRHLLRRFGLGATLSEVRHLSKMELSEAFEYLLDYDEVSEPYPISPWEFSTNTNNDKINSSGRLFSDWWALKMATTRRPLQEKIALFWHDHFAVSDIKIQDGRKMISYLQILRRNATGNFRTMLREISKEPAMVLFLDSHRNVKGTPNENFAREVMELFTLGEGNYEESDVLEAARAFTGWSFRDTLNYRERDRLNEQIRAKVNNGESIFVFRNIPGRHDVGTKTIFGKEGNFTGDDVLSMLLDHPQTARYICYKLWEWFAYPNPDDALVERLAKVFRESDYEIKPVLRAIAFSPEFWSKKAVRTKVKSPVDYTIAAMRQFNASAVLAKRDSGELDQFTPIDGTVRRFASIVNREMRRQGMSLLNPPSVEGWHWNEEWVTSETMTHRIDLSRRIFGNRRIIEPLIEWTAPELAVEQGEGDHAKLVDRLLELLDVEVSREQRWILVGAARRYGGNGVIYDTRKAVPMLRDMLKLVFAMPEAHIC
ncbi:MAG: DUF1800 domain-containing protein [Armatimonadetes bacterium]|nr:DUF1800 domain-containing protein [Armatimonadota bacterium]